MDTNLALLTHAVPADRIPQKVTDANAFAEYAARMAAQLAERPTIDVTAITTKEALDAALKAAQAIPAHDEQATIARRVAARAEAAIEQAWVESLATEVDPTFAEIFNATAARFTAAAEAAGDLTDHYLADKYDPAGAPLRQAIDELDTLRGHRDRIASLSGEARTDVYSTKYTQHSRTLWIKDAETWQKYIGRVANGEPVWIAAHRAGVAIRWQTLAEQQAQPIPAAVARAQAEMTSVRASTTGFGN
ncbi:hypothetical protein RS84_02870 [Microbacterium hydrocarbonoxydans]|uniref:Uncharacterized protein n=1 Tax=Microbacterium hydrocarbonoxydans TaxID=273678 RepID=A0A0M2HMU5_9MICO|nr:hypothetical protein [Microbacterium hydrocarbonoxydans]KJL46243.1 hypothetical protein RS84_02870 [Microbacterium hydrocarbonoxydans]